MTGLDAFFTFGAGVDPGVSLINFHPPETGFVWSSHTWCEIKFTLNPKGISKSYGRPEAALDIALDMDAFKALPNLGGQNVFFYVNGVRLDSRFIGDRLTVMLKVPMPMVRGAENIITIDTPDAAHPADYGLTDTRRLGIQIFSIRTVIL